MNEATTEPKQLRPLARVRGMLHWPFWIAVVLVFYALSIGPVMKLDSLGSFGYESDRFIRTFYAPIFYLIDHSKPVADFYFLYLFFLWRLPIY